MVPPAPLARAQVLLLVVVRLQRPTSSSRRQSILKKWKWNLKFQQWK